MMVFFSTAFPVIFQPSVLQRDRLLRLSLVFHPVLEHIDFSILTLHFTKILQDLVCLQYTFDSYVNIIISYATLIWPSEICMELHVS